MPVLYNSWYVTEFDVNYENQAAAAERAAELGVELFVMDDGWFGVRDDDTSGLGDWTVDPRKFPQGLGQLIDYVNSLGMEFGIWVEPEMVNRNSALYAAHPDWVYHFPNRPRNEGRNQLVLNVGRKDVQDYLLDSLHALLADHNIKFVKWDMNRSLSEVGWPDAEPGREQEVWIRHAQGVYHIFAELRRAHPHVLFESCSSGGGRVDLGILRYVEDFWMSDNVDPLDNILMFEGYSMAYPPKAKMMWVNDLFEHTQRDAPLSFRFHQAMTGALGLGANLVNWSPAELEAARRHIATYKSIREIVQHGDQYRLASLRQGDWAALQYVATDGKEAVVFVFLHASRFGPSRRRLRLQGLEPDALYRVDAGEVGAQPQSGAALMARGLIVEMCGDLQSRLIHIQRL
jgi:alpha-galactosidase